MSKLPFATGKARQTLKRRTAMRPKRRPRQEFARVYGGEARVRRQNARPCDLCGAAPPTEMAHVTNGGMGRKADAALTISACRACHHELDHGIGKKAVERELGISLRELAAQVDGEYHLEF